MLEIDGNNCIASDLEISNTKNVAANLEIDSQKLSLPIQKSIVELCPCWFRNRHQKTTSLSIQKSAAMVESFLALRYGFCF